ncbi:hypothetical protein CUMW_055790 [Citrus unshiu]|nr:hypothetical protein CUMW_055790 [Citrus unshiu]
MNPHSLGSGDYICISNRLINHYSPSPAFKGESPTTFSVFWFLYADGRVFYVINVNCNLGLI